MRIFEVLFNGSWPKSSTHAPEKCFENPDFIFCSSFQNIRLGWIKWTNSSRVWIFSCYRLLSTFSCHIRPPESSLPNEDLGRSSQLITVRCAPMFPEQSATAKTEAKSLAGAPLRRACSRRIGYGRCRTGCTPSFDRRDSLHVRASHPVSNDARSFR